MKAELRTPRDAAQGAAQLIHLNNCGASLPPDVVVQSVINHIRSEQQLGPYEAAAIAADRCQAVYRHAAQLIGCDPSEIAFCDSGSRALNVLVYSLRLSAGDRILISPLEFGSGVVALQHVAERSGAKLEVLPADSEGRVLTDGLEQALSHGKPPALVVITHAAAHSGSVNPVREIGRLVKAAGAFYIVDACQSVGAMPVSVDQLQCDALTVTGRKWLRGPRGTGLLYVRRGVSEAIDPVTSDLVTADYLFEPDRANSSRLRIRTDAHRFELWERNVAGFIGLGTALEYLLSLISSNPEIYDRILKVAQYAADQLHTIDEVEVWAPRKAQSGVLGFVVPGFTASAVKNACASCNINISTMSNYDAPLDFRRRGCSTVCRIGVHYFNSIEEIDQFICIIRNLVNQKRSGRSSHRRPKMSREPQ